MKQENQKSKRVCLIRQKSYPQQRNLRRSAETLVREGYEVDVICVGSKGQSKHEKLNGVNIHRIFYSYHRDKVFWYLYEYSAFFILAFLKLTRLSLKKRYDVVEVHTMPDFLVFVTLLARLQGTRVVLYMFENMPLIFSSSFGLSRNHIFIKLLRFIEKISAGYADHVIVSDGPLHKEEVESCGICESKITVVLNVPDINVFDVQPDCNSANTNGFNAVIVSTVLKRYGIQTVVKAVPLVIKEIPEIKINVLGDGEYLPRLKKMAGDLGISEYFNFAGYVPYEEVPAYIASADIGIAPMIDDVGAPNKIFEYFSMGKATVASSLPGLKVIFDSDSISYYQPGNEKELAERIIELYHDPVKREKVGQSAQELYKKYHWPVMLQRYLGVYKKLQ